MFDEYEVRNGKLVATPDLVQGSSEVLRMRTTKDLTFYEPLGDFPGLFLNFARLHEETDFEGAALRFSREYGLPDGEQTSPSPDGVGVQVEAGSLGLTRFREEVRRAWVVLALYEAVLNGAAQSIGSLFAEHGEGKSLRLGRCL